MIIPDAKKAATVILAKLKKPDSTTEVKPEESLGSASSPGLEAAAEDVMMALTDKSPLALVKALKAFVELCDEMPHEENESEE